MRASRFAGVAVGTFWLVLLVAFSSGLNTASQLAVYALLVTLIGFRRAHVIQWDDGSTAIYALTFGAALNFGPAGGATVGALSVFAFNMDKRAGVPGKGLIAKSAAGSVMGTAAGFAYMWASSAAPYSVLHQSMAILAAAAAFLVSSIVTHFLINLRRGLDSAVRKTMQSQPYSYDLAIGFGLAATVVFLRAILDSQPLVLALPVVYLARQLLGEQMPRDGMLGTGRRGDLVNTYASAMHALVSAIDARDRFTRMHTSNVVVLARGIGMHMGLDDDELEALRIAALFHDVGKLWVPEHILLRPGKLDQEQLSKVQCHPALGQRILDNISFPSSIGHVVRGHHERWDGTGYPDHLKGEEIPLGARILCLADVFDAMVSKRLYRPSNGLAETLSYIKGATGTHFDPSVVRALDELMAKGELPAVYKDAAARAIKIVESGDDLGMLEDPADDASVMGSEFVAVFEIAQIAGNALELDQILRLLAEKIRSMISCSTCAIFLRDPESDRLQAAVALGENAAYLEGAVTSLGRGQTGMVAENGHGIIADYDGRDLTNPNPQKPREKLTGWVTPCSVMIVPITSEDEGVVGTINLYQTSRPFSEEDLLLLNAVSREVGKAVQKALLFKETSDSAVTDLITGLHNARYMAARLDEELSSATRSNTALSILCMDLDSFKLVNDRLGHQQGDEVLHEMADIFGSQVREQDVVCRQAGDEFTIVLPGMGRIEALMTKRRIEVAVDSHEPYGSGASQVRVGVSIGIATFPEDGRDARSLIACADANMYAAKKARKGGDAAA